MYALDTGRARFRYAGGARGLQLILPNMERMLGSFDGLYDWWFIRELSAADLFILERETYGDW